MNFSISPIIILRDQKLTPGILAILALEAKSFIDLIQV